MPAAYARPSTPLLRVLLLALLLIPIATLHAQSDIQLELRGGAADRTRLGVANFKDGTANPQNSALLQVFNTTLFNDLSNAGIFDIVSRSLAPPVTPGSPQEMNLAQWSAAPASASMVAFGALGITGSRVAVNGYLFDTHNTQFPQVLAKQYADAATEDATRTIAHRFADDIILRLGGTPGIAESKIAYVHVEGGNKEIWMMDYDGANQHAVTHLGTISLSPRLSPDGSRIAFSSLERDGFQIRMYSLLLNRMVSFPNFPGTNISPAWAPNGNQIAFASSTGGTSNIYISGLDGVGKHRVTNSAPDTSPTFNPRSGAQLAYISGRSHLPQLYTVEIDGSSPQRLTDGGYATSPSWSPNGQFVAFAWNRKYGPGAPGGQDIYVMELSSRRWIQLTHDMGPCDFPSWSPDGRHIVFTNSPDGRATHSKVWTMLADGTQRHAITAAGADMPNWSWK